MLVHMGTLKLSFWCDIKCLHINLQVQIDVRCISVANEIIHSPLVVFQEFKNLLSFNMQSLSVLALTLVFLSQQVSGKDALPQPQIFADPAGPNYNTNERNPLPLNGACQTLDSYL